MGEVITYAVIYVIECAIAWLYSTRIFALRHPARVAVLLFGVGYLLQFLAVQLWDDLLVNFIGFFTVNALLLMLCFACSRPAALLHSALLSFVMGAAEIVTALALTPFTNYFGASMYSLSALIALTVISKLLYFVAAMCMTLLLRRGSDAPPRDPFAMLLLSALPLATAIVVIAFVYVGCTAPLTPLTEWLMVASMVALLAVDVLVLVIYNNIRRISQENTRLQLISQKDEAEARMYRLLQTQYDAQRVLIHDIRHHHRLLEEMLRQQQYSRAADYLQMLNRLPAVQKRAVFCSSPVLNTILQQHSEQCIAAGVQLHCQVASGCVEQLSPLDMTALFGNLLSNACRAAAASQEKYIDLEVGPAPTGDAVITLANSCDTPPLPGKNGLFRTDREADDIHGIGLSSIARVVDACSGTMQLRYDAAEKAVHTLITLSAGPGTATRVSREAPQYERG